MFLSEGKLVNLYCTEILF